MVHERLSKSEVAEAIGRLRDAVEDGYALFGAVEFLPDTGNEASVSGFYRVRMVLSDARTGPGVDEIIGDPSTPAAPD